MTKINLKKYDSPEDIVHDHPKIITYEQDTGDDYTEEILHVLYLLNHIINEYTGHSTPIDNPTRTLAEIDHDTYFVLGEDGVEIQAESTPHRVKAEKILQFIWGAFR